MSKNVLMVHVKNVFLVVDWMSVKLSCNSQVKNYRVWLESVMNAVKFFKQTKNAVL